MQQRPCTCTPRRRVCDPQPHRQTEEGLKNPSDLERKVVTDETAATPIQVKGNKKTDLVFTTTALADD